jgi:anti-sigma28 factor (negative regulator of flagellin synthesis)
MIEIESEIASRKGERVAQHSRENKIRELKESIASGQYEIDSSKIVECLLKELENLHSIENN